MVPEPALALASMHTQKNSLFSIDVLEKSSFYSKNKTFHASYIKFILSNQSIQC